MSSVPYKDFIIKAVPMPLRDGGFTVEVTIQKDERWRVVERRFSAKRTAPTREAAERDALDFGRAIIDGNVNGETVETM
jgi:hypothetical protein